MEAKQQTISIARALKEKSRLAKKLTKTRELFRSCNTRNPDERHSESAQELYDEMMELEGKYLAVRQAIAKANAGIAEQLTEMLFARAKIAFLSNLNCREEETVEEWRQDSEGKRYSTTRRVRLDTLINQKRRREMVEELESRLANLQDEVDAFNATHTVLVAV